jgi:hypothetical protein
MRDQAIQYFDRHPFNTRPYIKITSPLPAPFSCSRGDCDSCKITVIYQKMRASTPCLFATVRPHSGFRWAFSGASMAKLALSSHMPLPNTAIRATKAGASAYQLARQIVRGFLAICG